MITGLSGAGPLQAADSLEDLGWFVVDNLPPSLIAKVAELASAPGIDDRAARPRRRAAARTRPTCSTGVGRAAAAGPPRAHRCSSTRPPPSWSAATSSTRRKHPLGDGDGAVLEAIEDERDAARAGEGARPTW